MPGDSRRGTVWITSNGKGALYRADAVELFYWNDPKNTLQDARRWSSDDDEGVRFWAGMILMHDGKETRAKGLAVLEPILTGKNAGSYYAQAIDELLTAKEDPNSMKLAVGVIGQFSSHSSDLSYQRSAILKRLILCGRPEALSYIQQALNDRTSAGSSVGTRDGEQVSREQVAGDSLAQDLIYWRGENLGYDSLDPDDVREKKRNELSQWIGEQFKLIKAGKPSEIKPDMQPLRPSRWQVDTP